MTVHLVLGSGEATTSGAATATVLTLALAEGQFGGLTFELTGELSGDPTTTFTWTCDAMYSNDAGVATMRAQGTPVAIDPDAKAFTVTLDETGGSARLQVLGLVGENWVWSAKVSGLLRDAVIPTRFAGCTAWYNPFDLTSLTVDAAYTGANRLSDGDMEAAGTNPPWVPYDVNDVLTKEAVGPHGGAQWLKVERITSNGTLLVSQAAGYMTVNRVYYYNGWMRGDGVRAPACYLAPTAPALNVTYTSSVAWQEKTLVGTATDSYANFGCGFSNVGIFFGADDLFIIKLPSVTQMNDLSGSGNHATRALGANNPASYQIDDDSLWFSAAQAAKEKYLTGAVQNATEGTVWAWVWVSALPSAANFNIVGSFDGTKYLWLAILQTTGLGQAGIGNGAGTNVLASDVAVNVGAWNFMACTWSPTRLTVNINGTKKVIATANTVSTRAVVWGAFDRNGAIDTFFTGRMGQAGAYDVALTETQQAELMAGTAP